MTAAPAAAARSSPAAGPRSSPQASTRPPASPAAAGPTLAGSYTLPDLPLATVENAVLPGNIQDDHKLLLGSISDLWHARGDPPEEFWAITDRGPNGQERVQGQNRRTFPLPSFDPLLLRLRTEPGGAISLLRTIPLVGQSGKPIGGMPNLEGRDEAPFDARGQTRLGDSPSGIDPEAFVRTANGEFWLAEEYGPSLVRVDAGGKVLARYLPDELRLEGADYPVRAGLPGIYARRKQNRGFEGLALSPDETTLYAAIESPLANPNREVGDRSRNGRILAFDLVSGRPKAEYVYRFQPSSEFGDQPQDEMKLSAAVAVGPTGLAILERTDPVARLYQVDLSAATNILGTAWDDPSTTPSLEALADVPSGLTPLPKRLLVDLPGLPGVPPKIEGVALVDPSTLAFANDNDFDFTGFDRNGNAIPEGVKTKILVVQLPSPLP